MRVGGRGAIRGRRSGAACGEGAVGVKADEVEAVASGREEQSNGGRCASRSIGGPAGAAVPLRRAGERQPGRSGTSALTPGVSRHLQSLDPHSGHCKREQVADPARVPWGGLGCPWRALRGPQEETGERSGVRDTSPEAAPMPATARAVRRDPGPGEAHGRLPRRTLGACSGSGAARSGTRHSETSAAGRPRPRCRAGVPEVVGAPPGASWAPMGAMPGFLPLHGSPATPRVHRHEGPQWPMRIKGAACGPPRPHPASSGTSGSPHRRAPAAGPSGGLQRRAPAFGRTATTAGGKTTQEEGWSG